MASCGGADAKPDARAVRAAVADIGVDCTAHRHHLDVNLSEVDTAVTTLIANFRRAPDAEFSSGLPVKTMRGVLGYVAPVLHRCRAAAEARVRRALNSK